MQQMGSVFSLDQNVIDLMCRQVFCWSLLVIVDNTTCAVHLHILLVNDLVFPASTFAYVVQL